MIKFKTIVTLSILLSSWIWFYQLHSVRMYLNIIIPMPDWNLLSILAKDITRAMACWTIMAFVSSIITWPPVMYLISPEVAMLQCNLSECLAWINVFLALWRSIISYGLGCSFNSQDRWYIMQCRCWPWINTNSKLI